MLSKDLTSQLMIYIQSNTTNSLTQEQIKKEIDKHYGFMEDVYDKFEVNPEGVQIYISEQGMSNYNPKLVTDNPDVIMVLLRNDYFENSAMYIKKNSDIYVPMTVFNNSKE